MQTLYSSPAYAAIVLIIWVVCLVLNIWVAKKKGKNIALWVILSIFLSWIALVINALTGERKE